MTPFVRARKALDDLSQATGQLAASLMPGTARPWRAPVMSADKRAELDHQARLEMASLDLGLPAHLRTTRATIAPGESPAPYSFEIAELLTEVLAAADLLAETVAQHAGVERLATASSAYADPRPYLQHVHQHLLAALDSEPRLLEQVEYDCARLLRKAHEALGLTTDGQLLAAECPWCGGRTDSNPTGGARTLRVRTLPTGLPAVVCEGGYCAPADAECGWRWRGLPAWPQHEWDWLAERLERQEGVA